MYVCVCVCSVSLFFFFEHNNFTLFIKVEESKKKVFFFFAALVALRTALFQWRGKELAISTTKEETKDTHTQKKNEQCKLHNFIFVNARLCFSSPHLLPWTPLIALIGSYQTTRLRWTAWFWPLRRASPKFLSFTTCNSLHGAPSSS